jgi:DNA topoisomerase-1
MAGSSQKAVVAPPLSARAAGLRYVSDAVKGIRRVRHGTSFRYISSSGRPVKDVRTLERIRRLAIPPAWTAVWIASDPQAHLQATGRDARGRKQYRYHARWRDLRHQSKCDRMVPFAHALPQLRRRVRADLAHPLLTKAKVLAAVVDLLEKTFLRVGNVEYARTNGSFGLTTLRDGHVKIRGAELRFAFRGKSGIQHSVALTDARLAKIVKRCQELPGQTLFQYVDDDGRRRKITSADVNAYLREATGSEFTAKDFRTWAATLLAVLALRDEPLEVAQRQKKSAITRAIARVAEHLGNTPTVCRASYIHPCVVEAYADGTLHDRLARPRRVVRGLSADETAVLALLEGRRHWRQQLAEAARAA